MLFSKDWFENKITELTDLLSTDRFEKLVLEITINIDPRTNYYKKETVPILFHNFELGP